MSYTRQSVDAIRNIKRMTANRKDMLDYLEKRFMEDGMSESQAKMNARAEYKRALWRNAVKFMVSAFILPLFWELSKSLPYIGLGDDDEKKKQMFAEVLRKELLSGPVEGLVGGNALNTIIGMVTSQEVLDSLKQNGLLSGGETALKNVSDADLEPLPLAADMRTMFKTFGYDKIAGFQELVSLAMQIGSGIDPKTLTDIPVAAIDASNGDLGKAKEIELFMLRMLQFPSSTTKDLYLDEIGMSADDAKKLSYEQLANRYAEYNFNRRNPLFGWVYTDEAEKKRRDSYVKRFNEMAAERIGLFDDEKLADTYNGTDDFQFRKMAGKEISKRTGVEDPMMGSYSTTKDEAHKEGLKNYIMSRSWADITEDMEVTRMKREAEASGDKKTEKALESYVKGVKEIIYQMGTPERTDANGNTRNDSTRLETIRKRRRGILDKYGK
jgi:hypothetical protein